MKLYLRQRIFSFADNYDITDENKTPVYKVKSKLFSFGTKMRVMTPDEQEVYFINQKVWHLMPHYQIEKNGTPVGMVIRRFGFRPRFDMEGELGAYSIRGNVWAFDFEIVKGEQVVAVVHKKFFSMTDSYEISVMDDSLQDIIITLVLVFDTCIHNNSRHSN